MSRSPLAIRMLHTSLAHRAPAAAAAPRTNARNALASAFARPDSPRTSSPLGSDAARQMFDKLASRAKVEVDDKRYQFKAGSWIAPHSLTSSSLYPEPRPNARPPLLGPPRKVAVKLDPFHLSGTSPLAHDLNPLFPLAFVNQMGKIKGRAETGLTWKSQRKVGKLVRRARAMGLISRWSNQPVPGGLASRASIHSRY
ncbi:ribosomal protein S18 [Kwoniella sp. DSM 27419]